eukprot:m.47514 g.47514  ORF g.47514 m.47514 type:complete len:170 (+) comp12636_c0_seq1:152-661(+)
MAPKVKISLMSRVQGPVQAFLRPAMWIPGLRNIRYHTETRQFSQSAADINQALVRIFTTYQAQVEDGTGPGLLGNHLVLHTMDTAKGYFEIHSYTPNAEWLDVIQAYVTPSGSGCSVRLRSWSSGVLPTIIPLAPLLNIAFFFFPFAGRDPKIGWTNSARVREIFAKLQ